MGPAQVWRKLGASLVQARAASAHARFARFAFCVLDAGALRDVVPACRLGPKSMPADPEPQEPPAELDWGLWARKLVLKSVIS